MNTPSDSMKRRAPRKSLVVTRNGMPCTVASILVRAADLGLVFRGRVAVPLPIPPSGPYVFRNEDIAEHVARRSRLLAEKLRGSLFRSTLVERFPQLGPFAVEATFTATNKP
jgi:hypothetical protein